MSRQTTTAQHSLALETPLSPQAGGWQERLGMIVETMREMSTHTDPQDMVRAYSKRMRRLLPTDRSISLSRRDLEKPHYRVTRSSVWSDPVNPWKQKDRLPILEGGLLSELIYGNAPRVIDDVEISADDPASEHLQGNRSLIALPLYDGGEALNMVVMMRRERAAFQPVQLPEWVWVSNLFGRATHNLVLSEQLQKAYNVVDRELQVVADIQRSLLPAELPDIPTMSLAARYQTSKRAGGDYYDLFPLPNGLWGILIADVSGHGTPAAVVMAILHSIVHTYPENPTQPGRMLSYVNNQLTQHYTANNGTFATAFYGIYDPQRREMLYSSAGHNPPRIKRCVDGSLHSLADAQSLPLGVLQDTDFAEASHRLEAGDQLIFYTDGITEAMNAQGELFGTERLDDAIECCHLDAGGLLDSVVRAVDDFSGSRPPDDDRTMLIAKIS